MFQVIVDTGVMMKDKREEIAVKAYEIWEREGRPENKAREHWLRAEQEVLSTSDRPEGGAGVGERHKANVSVEAKTESAANNAGCCSENKGHKSRKRQGATRVGRDPH